VCVCRYVGCHFRQSYIYIHTQIFVCVCVCVCVCVGTLVVTFDNSYSLLRSKTFNYKIDVSDDKSAITSGVTARLGGLSL